ncbi:MAG TPA: DUF4136 domain-containing protein [Vicinamibacterales bacterium]
MPIVVSVLLCSTLVAAQKIKTDVKFDKTAVLVGSHSYKWLESPEYMTNVAPDILKDERLEKAALDAPIRAAVDRALAAKGWHVAAAGETAEFEVVYYAFLSTDVNSAVLGSFYQYTNGWSPVIYTDAGRQSSGTSIIEKGTIVVDVVNPARQSAVWRGVAAGSLDRSRAQDKRIAVIGDAIKKLFEKFPPKS